MKRVKNSMRRKVISSVLAAAIMFSAVPFGPITALAEDNTDTAISTTTAEISTTAETTSVPENTATEGTSVAEGTEATKTETGETTVTEETSDTSETTTVPTGFIDDENAIDAGSASAAMWQNGQTKGSGSLSMYNVKQVAPTITVKKVDDSGNLLPSDVYAEIKVTWKNNDTNIGGAGTFAEWYTDDENPKTLTLPMNCKYTFEETYTPNGYEGLSDTFTLNVDNEGNITLDANGNTGVTFENNELVIVNKRKQQVWVSKLDDKGSPVEGAELTVLDSGGNVYESWTTNGYKNPLELAEGTYTLKETSVPDGYKQAADIKITVAADGTVTCDPANALSGNIITMVDAIIKTEVKIKKVDENGNPLSGAYFYLYKGNKWVAEWLTDSTGLKTLELPVGSYTITEDETPYGYKEISQDIEFSINADGDIILAANSNAAEVKINANGEIEIVNTKSVFDVEIEKVGPDGQKLGGARLRVVPYPNPNSVGTEWTSSSTESKIIELSVGTYTLSEEDAPEGYAKADNINFLVSDDGKIVVYDTYGVGIAADKVVMKDEYAKIYVPVFKLDDNGDRVIGAKLEIKDSDGNVVDEWTTNDMGYMPQLVPGTYTLTEVDPPAGYKKADDITFIVKADGTVESVGSDTWDDVNKVLVMVDEKVTPFSVVIVKYDDYDFLVGDAKLVIEDSSGVQVDSWTTFAVAGHTATLAPGTYTLKETETPAGYKKAEDIKITVAADSNVTCDPLEAFKNGEVRMVDECIKTPVTFKKVDQNGDPVEEALLTLYKHDSYGGISSIEQWATDASGLKTFELPVNSIYELSEMAPAGYNGITRNIGFSIDINGNITLDANSNAAEVRINADGQIEIINELIINSVSVEISKQDIAGVEIAGAELKVTDANGNVVESWTSAACESKTIALQPGNYTLTETTAPQGYVVAESIEFTVTADGTVTCDSLDNDGKIVMVDEMVTTPVITVKKVDENGDLLSGTDLYVEDIDGGFVTIAEWITDDTNNPQTINLALNHKYQLWEYYPTEKYKMITTPVYINVDREGKITVNDNGLSEVTYDESNNEIVIVNEPIYVVISKQNIAGEEIAGAKLKIVDASGNVVEEWTSAAGESKQIKIAEGSYKLIEVSAPQGYEIAESIDFTVNGYGEVTSNNLVNGEIVMVDKYADTELVISKRSTSGKLLKGAVIEVTGRFTDDVVAEGGFSDIYMTPEVFRFKSGLTDTVLKNLPAGTYTIKELTAPEGYIKSDEIITAVVGADGSVTVDGKVREHIIIENAPVLMDVSITKTDDAGNALAGAVLKLVNNDTGEVTTWTTDANAKIFQLEKGSYTLVEARAPEGYVLAADIDFEVTDSNKSITMVDEKTSVSFTMTDIGGRELKGAKITLTSESGADMSGASVTGGQTELNVTASAITFVSGDEGTVIKGLPAGKYRFHEEAAPDGYVVATDIVFEIKADGTVTVNGRAVTEIKMVDRKASSTGGGSEQPKPDNKPGSDIPNMGIVGGSQGSGEYVEPIWGYTPPSEEDEDDDYVEDDISSAAGAETDEFVLDVESSSPAGYVVTLIVFAAAGFVFLRLRRKPRSRF